MKWKEFAALEKKDGRNPRAVTLTILRLPSLDVVHRIPCSSAYEAAKQGELLNSRSNLLECLKRHGVYTVHRGNKLLVFQSEVAS